MKTAKHVCIVAIAGLCGCASLWNHNGEHPGVYPGVENDVGLLSDREEPVELKLFAIVDLPLSAALDTALLPFDFVYWFVKKDSDE